MKKIGTYQVKQVALFANVSVRTLHYYDEIGLLVPVLRSKAGYRLYDSENLLRLQQIMIGRKLGLSLEDIRKSLDDENFDLKATLFNQRRQLVSQVLSTTEMIQAVDKAIELLSKEMKGDDMSIEQLFSGFVSQDYEAEVAERWGETEAFKISAERTRNYSDGEWQQIKQGQDDIYQQFAMALQLGKNPQDEGVMELAETHRQFLDRWFYPCSLELHKGLADLYEADARFQVNIDKYAEGLTPFVCAAIRANALA
ncbi:MAG: MerR family transcriptional regulator [Rhizobiales bacterium]|nr:MerR family transcriptional regulator [Hyphomicrobiales bacterium]